VHKGSGSEGIALVVQKADYLASAAQSPHRVVVKLRVHEYTRARRNLMELQCIARELVQGVLAEALGMPFVVGLSHWWMWDGSVYPAATDRHHVHPLPRPGVFDVTDLLSVEAAFKTRRERVLVEMPSACETPLHNWHSLYQRMRAQQVSQPGFRQLPCIVMEQSNAGETTLYDMVRTFRLLDRTYPGGWAFVRAQVCIIAQMVAHLQDHFGWVHGDLYATNIVLRAYRSGELPDEYKALLRSPGGGASLRSTDLALGGDYYVPRFIDLSRSAIDPARAVRQLAAAGARAAALATFEHDAIDYVDPCGASSSFSHTVDMRRLGLSLCALIARALHTSHKETHVPPERIDPRIVRVARMLIGVPVERLTPALLALGTRAPGATTCTAKSRTFDEFISRVVWLDAYLESVERLAMGIGEASDRARAVGPGAVDTCLAVERHVSCDLNPWIAWAVSADPAFEAADDPRRPAAVAASALLLRA
jgi:hypothetical protein